jgi:hypothetical protein
MLETYVDVPRATSLLNMRYIPTPTRHRSTDSDQQEFDSADEADFEMMLAELYSRPSRYELDIAEYERSR